jgi:hypothetical protein
MILHSTYSLIHCENLGNDSTPLIEPSEQFLPSENELTTWYHDGSNTTGWTVYSNGWTLNTTGTSLFSSITPASAGIVHANFIYYLDTPLVVGHDFKMEAQVDYTPGASDNGGANIMAYSSPDIVWRFPYSSLSGYRHSWALNYYDTTNYDSEYTFGSLGYTSMWYNASNSNTETNLGDGTVSTSEHAGASRVIQTILLDFWLDDNGVNTYPNITIDWIKLTGGARPEVDAPSDIEMEYTDSLSLTWNPEVYNPDEYELYIDDVLEDTVSWDGSPISIPLNGLDPDYYKYEIVVYDDLGLSANDIVWVNVTDTTVPTVEDVGDFELLYGVSGEYLTWTCSEPYPDYFIITNESVVIDHGNWNGSSLSVLLDGLAIGSYLYEVTVNDTSGNIASDVVNVTIVADNPPTITPLDDDIIELGTSGSYLVWDCADDYPDFFNISRNGTLVDSGAWNGSSLAVSLDGLALGVHYFTLFVNDTGGNFQSDSVQVSVTDTTSPILIRGQDSPPFYWEATDFAPSQYILYQNGTEISTMAWTTSPVVATIDLLYINTLAPGVYNFTIVFIDSTGNSATDTVIFHLDTTTTTVTPIPTSSTTTTTISDTNTTTTDGGEVPDSLLLVAIGALGAVVVILLLVILLRKGKSS